MSKRKSESDDSSLPATIQGYKKSKKYITESLLTPYDFIPDNVRMIGVFRSEDPVYLRSQVIRLESRNTWRHSHMRKLKPSARPVRVISRNVGGIQRSIELFSFDQTEPLEQLVASRERGIPANDYGNVQFDHLPENAALIETTDLPRAMWICRGIRNLAWCRCQNGWRRKTPNYVGIVVLCEDETRVRAELQQAEQDEVKSEKQARDNAALSIWRVLIQRIKAEFYIQKVIDKR